MHSTYEQFTQPGEAVESRVGEILAKLTLEEKIDLLGGENIGTKANEKAGIPKYLMADGPMGVHWHCDSSTAYPASIAAAASWDREAAYQMGAAIGRDARARGVHILLAPGVNIYRSALCGRNFEYLGEDPYLSAQMVVPIVKGCQSMGVATTVKHYAVNYQEFDRHNISSDLDERTLREVYLPAFKAAVQEGGTGAIMTAYNLVNGVHASEHDQLINQILKGEWGFDGLVMSDWVSTYCPVGAANGGLDLEMPTARFLNREELLPAVRNGLVPEEAIDDKIRRLLRLGICFGWFDHEQQDKSIPLEDPETHAVALEVARRGSVLLRNEGSMLPLDRSQLKKVAVVGPSAHPAVIGGGGSAYTTPSHVVSMLEGIRALAGEGVEVVHESGPSPAPELSAFESSQYQTPDGQPGLQAEYYDNAEFEGEPVIRVEERLHFVWGGGRPVEGINGDLVSMRFRGKLIPEQDGGYIFYASQHDGLYRVVVGGEEVIDAWEFHETGTKQATVQLKAGVPAAIVVEYKSVRHYVGLHVGWVHEDAQSIRRQAAVDAARSADVAIVCAGFDRNSEGEGHDRSFAMQADVAQLVADVAEVNPNTVVVLTAGGNLEMASWIDRVNAVLHAWYPGQEGGTAVAEILFGEVNPSGKLPATFEKKLEDRSSFDCYQDEDGDKRVLLEDGIFTGYRHVDREGVEPLFPFGFGLSYTTFEYENLKLSSDSISAADTLTVSFDIVNTGERRGADVAQLYVADSEAAVPRPVKELKGFDRVDLDPGERRTVEIQLDRSALEYFDPTEKAWVAEPGEFEVLIGASSMDIRLRAGFALV